MTELEFVSHSSVELLRFQGSDLDVARAAWVSHDAEAEKKEAEEGRVEGLINFLWKNGHTSPFEHGQFTFKVETPIFVAREFMRHRTWSYNEVSGRYSELSPRFYAPGVLRPMKQIGKVGAYTFEGDPKLATLTRGAIMQNSSCAWGDYQDLLERGVAREVARMVLPVNLMTTFIATVNPLNLMRFLDLRMDRQALYEILDVALQMDDFFSEAMPLTHAAWKAGK